MYVLYTTCLYKQIHRNIINKKLFYKFSVTSSYHFQFFSSWTHELPYTLVLENLKSLTYGCLSPKLFKIFRASWQSMVYVFGKKTLAQCPDAKLDLNRTDFHENITENCHAPGAVQSQFTREDGCLSKALSVPTQPSFRASNVWPLPAQRPKLAPSIPC